MTALLFVWWAVTSIGGEPSDAGWPQWRGPTHDGISRETDLVDSWPNSGPQVLWSRSLGQGFSSFVAVGDRVYTQTQSVTEQAVICLEADSGKTIWSYRYAWPSEANGLYPGPKATPTYHEGRVYYAAPDGVVGGLDAADGSLIWSVNPKRQYHGRGTDFGCSCSPLVIDGKVIIPVGGPMASVVALNATDGTTAWSSGDAAASYCTPVPITYRGQKQVLTFLENTLAAFELDTGRRVWNLEFSQGYDEHAAAPLYQEPFVLVASPFRSGAKLLKIGTDPKQPADAAGREAEPKMVWENPKFSNDVMSSVLYGGFVYGFDLKDAQSRLNRPSRGEFRCLDFQSGKIQWSTDQVGQANIIHADGKLILFNDNGEVILAEASPKRYRELARTMLFEGEVCWTPPALHRGRLYLRTQTRAVCLYLGKKALDPLQPVQSVATIPRTWRIDVNLLLGGEREFPATTPEWDELVSWYEWGVGAILAAFGLIESLCGGLLVMSRGRGKSKARSTQAGHDTVQISPHALSFHAEYWLKAGRFTVWPLIMLLGCIGSPILNRRLDYYVFSWPLTLWAALQVTLMAISWAEKQSDRRQSRWWSRLAGLLLMALSAGYYLICRRIGISIEWGFLIGYLLAFPVAAICSPGLVKSHRFAWLTDPLLALISFSAYFWACGAFLKWWLVVGS
jgi:outer membrane protein assembly factor BamB